MKRLAEGDGYFADLRAAAEKEGKVLRYVGVIDPKTKTVKCSLEKYVLWTTTPLGSLAFSYRD